MRPVPARQVVGSLLAKGFAKGENTDHEFYFLLVNGEQTSVFFKVSFGEGDIGLGIQRRQALQWGIRGDDVFKIISCEHNEARTRELLLAQPPQIATPYVPPSRRDYSVGDRVITVDVGEVVGVATNGAFNRGRVLEHAADALVLEVGGEAVRLLVGEIRAITR